MKRTTQKEQFVSIGRYLKDKRMDKGLSQIEVAKVLSCKSQFISNWERGLCTPPWEYLKTIVRLYQVPERDIMDFLLTEQEKMIRKNLGFKVKKSVRKH